VSVLLLTEVRSRAAAALAPASDTDPQVFVDVVDSVTPPALLLVWDDPWLVPATVAGMNGFYNAQLVVLCVAARLEPGPGVEALEQLVDYTISRLHADVNRWPQASSQAPRVFEIGGVPYLGARVIYRVPVSTGGVP
jgi:hypothetical protein